MTNERKEWTKEEIDFLIRNYNKIDFDEISHNIKHSLKAIRKKAYDLNLTNKQNSYMINEHYFDEIDSEEKAYWLGFIWCDGYVCIKSSNRKRYDFNLRLMKDDVGHLIKLRNALKSNHPIKFLKYGNGSYNNNQEIFSKLYISNKVLTTTLHNKYEITPYREYPENIIRILPNELVKHFIRGLLDGDGSFSYYVIDGSINKYSIDFGGSEKLLRFIENYFMSQGLIDISNRKLYKRHKEDNRDGIYRSLKISGKIQVINILNHLYCNSTIYLDRKYQKYKSIA